MLVRCVYASRARTGTTASIYHDICLQSQRNNTEHGITGILCWTNDVFVQVLEGGRDAVCDLFQQILTDNRHTHVRLLSFEDIEARAFGNWSMGRIDLANANPAIIMKYSETKALDPFQMTGRATMAILKDMLSAGAITKMDAISRPGGAA